MKLLTTDVRHTIRVPFNVSNLLGHAVMVIAIMRVTMAPCLSQRSNRESRNLHGVLGTGSHQNDPAISAGLQVEHCGYH
jgi:hypothetical protein